MRRRQFIKVLGGGAIALPFAARAQQTMPVIGFLGAASPGGGYARPLSAFLAGLNETGYAEGRNVKIEYRWAEGHDDRIPGLAADLIQHRVGVIVATSTPAALAAKAATTTIPIVFETAADPIRIGLVTSINRPGGNITGVTQQSLGIVPKELEFLHEMTPTARVMALLVNPSNSALADPETKEMLAAAQTLGVELHVLKASSENEFDAAFASATQLGAGGLVIGTDPLFTDRSGQLAALAARHAMPAAYKGLDFAEAGGLLSYGADITKTFHLVGTYVGRILKGEKPADLPVRQATDVEMFLNLKTAKALGITVPLPLLGRADKVFE